MSRQTEHTWETLCQAGLIDGIPPETGTLESPWYVKVLLAFSGWLAAVFLLGFIGIGFEFVYRNNTAAFIIGGIMIGAAFAILRIPANEFVEHLALAMSLAGQALVVFAIFNISNHNEKIAWMLVVLMEVPLAVIMPNFVHGVFSCFFAVSAFSIALSIMGWHHVVGGIVLLLTAICWLNEFDYPQHMKKIRAIGYGLVLALIQIKGTALFGYRTMGWGLPPNHAGVWGKTWLGELLIGAVTLYVVWHLLQRYKQTVSSHLLMTALSGALLLCAVSIEVQGITIGMVIMLLGFAGTNRVLLGLGIVSLLFYLSAYYYLLDTTLLDKSQSLFFAGLVLLIIRWLMSYILPFKKGGTECIKK